MEKSPTLVPGSSMGTHSNHNQLDQMPQIIDRQGARVLRVDFLAGNANCTMFIQPTAEKKDVYGPATRFNTAFWVDTGDQFLTADKPSFRRDSGPDAGKLFGVIRDYLISFDDPLKYLGLLNSFSVKARWPVDVLEPNPSSVVTIREQTNKIKFSSCYVDPNAPLVPIALVVEAVDVEEETQTINSLPFPSDAPSNMRRSGAEVLRAEFVINGLPCFVFLQSTGEVAEAFGPCLTFNCAFWVDTTAGRRESQCVKYCRLQGDDVGRLVGSVRNFIVPFDRELKELGLPNQAHVSVVWTQNVGNSPEVAVLALDTENDEVEVTKTFYNLGSSPNVPVVYADGPVSSPSSCWCICWPWNRSSRRTTT